jgi:hypothetical protein
VGCALALVASGCGSRLSDDQLAARRGHRRRRRSHATTAPGGAPRARSQGPMFGTMPVPVRSGPEGFVAGGQRDRRQRDHHQDRGGLRPGRCGEGRPPPASRSRCRRSSTSATASAASTAAPSNWPPRSTRKLFSHLEATKEACNAGVFAIVGSGSVTDNQGAQPMVDCGLPRSGLHGHAAKGPRPRTCGRRSRTPRELQRGTSPLHVRALPDAVKKAAIIHQPDRRRGTRPSGSKKAYEARVRLHLRPRRPASSRSPTPPRPGR